MIKIAEIAMIVIVSMCTTIFHDLIQPNWQEALFHINSTDTYDYWNTGINKEILGTDNKTPKTPFFNLIANNQSIHPISNSH